MLGYISLVFLEVILPILLLMAVGAALQKKFNFQLRPIANLITYCFMPAAVFLNMYQVDLNYDLLRQLFMYLLIFSIILIVLSTIIEKLFKFKASERLPFKRSRHLMN